MAHKKRTPRRPGGKVRGRREAFLEETLDWNRARTWPLLQIRVLLQCNIRITYQCVNDYRVLCRC